MGANTGKTRLINVSKVINAQWQHTEDELAVEEPLAIQLESGSGQQREVHPIAVTMRTPGNDLELSVGFLFTEGIISHSRQIEHHRLSDSGNEMVITLKEGVTPSLQHTKRNFYTTSSCGVCGKSNIADIKTVSVFNIHDNPIAVNTDVIQQLEKALLKQQVTFSKTGGLHAAALFNTQGNLVSMHEDVGRHNALDKAIGAAFLKDALPLSGTILLLSGRASFELIQKASMAGIAIVAAVGAPSSLAVALAKECGITLIGFLRNDRFNIYCGAERIHIQALPR